MTDKNQQHHDPTSLDAWKEHNTITVMFNEQIGFELKQIDVIAWLSEDEDNPLLATMQASMVNGNGSSPDKPSEPSESDILVLSAKIDELLIELTVSPPLTEQDGNSPENSLSLRSVPFPFKMDIFGALTGGEIFGKAAGFRGEKTSNVVAAPTGK